MAERSGHSYGSSNIDGAARVQLGDTYTYNYSLAEAKEAIYSDTLTITLGQLLEHPSLQGRFSKVPGSGQISSRLREELTDKLELLQTYLARVQRTEQRSIQNRSSYNGLEHLQHALADRKVSAYMGTTIDLLPKLSNLAKSQCTNKPGVSCLDEFCDLVERLAKQINARRNLCGTIEHVPAGADSRALAEPTRIIPNEQTVLNGEDTDNTNIEADSHASGTIASDELEYLYATQDFWRQLAWILQTMLEMRRACWKRLLKYAVPTLAILVPVLVLVNTAASDAPLYSRLFGSTLGSFFVLWFAYAIIVNRRFARRLMKNKGAISLPPV